MDNNKKPIRTSIGGQALIEGVMMKSPEKTAVTVRLPDKSLETKMFDSTPLKDKYKILGWPLLRGIAGFIDSMKLGMETLLYSADKVGLEEEEPSKFDLWLKKHFGDNLIKVVSGVGMVLGLALALLLFFWLPSFLFNLIQDHILPLGDIWRAFFEGVLRMGIFIVYIVLCSRIDEMRRVFMYHGAEHKTIACFESGEELTVENVRTKTRFHPRCGTSFMILMLLIGVIAGMLIPQTNPFARSAMKILILPLIMGVGYELLRLCGRYENVVTRIIATPGLWMQRLTTKEPDDDQIEVAVCAFVAAAPASELTEEMKATALYIQKKNEVIVPQEEQDAGDAEEKGEDAEGAESETNQGTPVPASPVSLTKEV